MARKETERLYRVNGHRHLIAAYEAHAEGLFDYRHWLTADPDLAALATHHALIAAHGCDGRLDDVTALKAWLYGAARNECLRVVRPRSGARCGPRPFRPSNRPPQPDRLPARPGRVVAGLSTTEQEIAELAFRHRLTSTEIALVLGRSTPSIRKELRHVHAVLALKCGRNVAERFTAPVAAPIPEGLRADLLDSAAIRSRVAYHANRSRPHRRTGYPAPLDQTPPRIRPVPAILAAAVVGALLLAGAVAYRPATSTGAAAAASPTPSADTGPHGRRPRSTPTPSKVSPSRPATTGTVSTAQPRPAASASIAAPTRSCAEVSWPGGTVLSGSRNGDRSRFSESRTSTAKQRTAPATCVPTLDNRR